MRPQSLPPPPLLDQQQSSSGVRSANSSASKDPQPAAALEIGSIFGRYRIIERLGTGGFGQVFFASTRGVGGEGRACALKVIHPHLADDEMFKNMFEDEANLASAVDHPNVCRVFDSGEVDGKAFIAMDYICGEPLSAVCSALHQPDQPMDSTLRHALAAEVVAQAASGLHAAHEALGPDGLPLSIVHRDVALANLFLRYDGYVEVLDFGISRARLRSTRTQQGILKGRLSGMSPEQLRGSPLDRRVDVWGLGIVLYELLCGRSPFRRSTQAATLMAVVQPLSPRPRQVDRSIPPELENIVLRALATECEDRYATARDLEADLRKFLRGVGVGGPSMLSDALRALRPGGQAVHQRRLRKARQEAPGVRRPDPTEVMPRERRGPPSAVSGAAWLLAGALLTGLGLFIGLTITRAAMPYDQAVPLPPASETVQPAAEPKATTEAGAPTAPMAPREQAPATTPTTTTEGVAPEEARAADGAQESEPAVGAPATP